MVYMILFVIMKQDRKQCEKRGQNVRDGHDDPVKRI